MSRKLFLFWLKPGRTDFLIKQYWIEIMLAVALIIIGAGCKSICLNSQRDQPHYTLTAKLIEGSSLELKRIAAKLYSSSTYIDDLDIDTILRSPSVTIVNFPSSTLRVGETKEVSNQHYIRYPITFDKKGRPEKFEKRGVGQKIRVRLVEANNSEATVEGVIESVKEPTWTTYAWMGFQEIKHPVFQSRTLNPNITISLDRWLAQGGMVSKNDNCVFIMKITKEE